MGSFRIYLSPPDVGEAERRLLLGAFDSGWIAPLGPHVDAVEADGFGEFGVVSFNGNKIITTSGGAILTDDAATAKQARAVVTQSREPAQHYEHIHAGYNHR